MLSNICLALSLLIFGLQSHASNLESCFDLYSKRGESIDSAVHASECFLTNKADSIESDHWIAMSYIWVVLKTNKKELKRKYIDLGIAHVSEMSKNLNLSGITEYWKAVFMTQDAKDADEGAILPRKMLSSLSEIKENLKFSIANTPKIHGYGPNRVYGIMYLEMPAIVGGDIEIALSNLRTAFENAPEYSDNIFWYAKALLKNKEKEKAIELFEQLISVDLQKYNPDRIPETMHDISEAKKILEKIKK